MGLPPSIDSAPRTREAYSIAVQAYRSTGSRLKVSGEVRRRRPIGLPEAPAGLGGKPRRILSSCSSPRRLAQPQRGTASSCSIGGFDSQGFGLRRVLVRWPVFLPC